MDTGHQQRQTAQDAINYGVCEDPDPASRVYRRTRRRRRERYRTTALPPVGLRLHLALMAAFTLGVLGAVLVGGGR